MHKSMTIAAATLAAVFAQPATAEHHEAPQEMAAALSQANRDEDRARDQYRHPSETLAFFGVKPGMTVVDYMPAGGWYTRVLVPYLGAEGRYVGILPTASVSPEERFSGYFAGLPAKFAEAHPTWDLSGAPVSSYVSAEVPEELTGSVDRVLIFREMHNLHRSGILHHELTQLRKMLKDDGMLGIVQHRAKADAPAAYTDGNKGYLKQKDVIGLVEAHGFELVGASEINANAADPADHPEGVWELPPGLRTKRDELKAIGESDRMTLLFRKAD